MITEQRLRFLLESALSAEVAICAAIFTAVFLLLIGIMRLFRGTTDSALADNSGTGIGVYSRGSYYGIAKPNPVTQPKESLR